MDIYGHHRSTSRIIKRRFHVQFIARNALQLLCNKCGLSITLESPQLLHSNCSALLAINCTWNHGVSRIDTGCGDISQNFTAAVSAYSNPSSKCYESIANALWGNRACRACYEDATRMLATFSDHFNMSRWSDVSLTCLQQVVRVVFVEFGERHDKRVALPQLTADRPIRQAEQGSRYSMMLRHRTLAS